MKKRHYWMLGIFIFAVIIVVLLNYPRNYTSQFKGPVSAEEPIPQALIDDLEKYVKRLMRRNEVPGLAMVLVQGDQIVYQQGFGVKDLETKEPVSVDTLMGIGSTTKSMTAIMMASLVDEGIIAWDTPLTDILPAFRLSNPEITKKMTLRHTLCMCSSVPEQKEGISVNYSEMSPEDVIEMLASVPLAGIFESSFNYSSAIVAAGGYLTALAAGGEYGNLAQAYADLMQERLFNPLGMTASTFSIDEAVASGDYATPHYSSLAGYEAIPPEIEGVITPMAPAGALWSNIEDLAKYLIMLLNDGVAANGQRVISHENLAYLWKSQIAIDDKVSYGLGWDVEDYHGLRVIHHPGGIAGFASELVVIPELDIGLALLTNRLDIVKPIGRMVTYRLLEMLTGSEQVYDHEISQAAKDIDRQIFSLSLVTRKKVDPDKIAPFLGSYHNDKLGDVRLVLHADRTLWVDFGEYESSVRRMLLEENQFIFYESVFVGKTLQLKLNADGTPTMRWSGEEGSYNFISQDE